MADAQLRLRRVRLRDDVHDARVLGAASIARAGRRRRRRPASRRTASLASVRGAVHASRRRRRRASSSPAGSARRRSAHDIARRARARSPRLPPAGRRVARGRRVHGAREHARRPAPRGSARSCSSSASRSSLSRATSRSGNSGARSRSRTSASASGSRSASTVSETVAASQSACASTEVPMRSNRSASAAPSSPAAPSSSSCAVSAATPSWPAGSTDAPASTTRDDGHQRQLGDGRDDEPHPVRERAPLECAESGSCAARSGCGRGVGPRRRVVVPSSRSASASSWFADVGVGVARHVEQAGAIVRAEPRARERVRPARRDRAVALHLLVHERRIAEVRREQRELVGAIAGRLQRDDRTRSR